MYIICRLGGSCQQLPVTSNKPWSLKPFFLHGGHGAVEVQPQAATRNSGSKWYPNRNGICARELAVEIPYTPPNHPPKKTLGLFIELNSFPEISGALYGLTCADIS